jgi:hypothetical protein
VLTDVQGRFRLPVGKKSRRITAWKHGYAIAGVLVNRSPLRLDLNSLPKRDHEDYHWIDPAPDAQKPNNCANCHQEIYREWQGSAHGRAATGKRFLSLFGGTDWQGRPSPRWSLRQEHPLGLGVCATCHAPTFRDPELEYDLTKVTGVAARGVHCDYCHKIVDAPVGKVGHTFGRDGYDLLRPGDGRQLFFGPLDDAFREGESFGYSPLYTQSRYCASCHEGIVFGVRVYGTYTEWLASPARKQGQHCQTCHMKPTGRMTNIAPGKGGIERLASTLASHHFPGGTTELLKKCLQLEIKAQRDKGQVTISVTVSAHNVGHQVPTGFIDRNLVLVVEAFNGKSRPVDLQSGPKLPPAAGKELAGTAGRLYAKMLQDRNGGAPQPFWLPHDKMTDTRLLPETSDRRQFVFGADTRKVRVRLLYRRFWPEVVRSKGWPDDTLQVFEREIRLDQSAGRGPAPPKGDPRGVAAECWPR